VLDKIQKYRRNWYRKPCYKLARIIKTTDQEA